MELRQLLSDQERRLFAQNLVQTRMVKGAGFSETKRSMVGEVHLAFGRLYALFDDQGPAPDEMLAGFVLHDLATFPQSYPKPDLCQYAPEFTFECGELWAKAAGSARLVRHAARILVGQLHAEAVLVYPIFKPWNLTIMYREDFARIGDPIEWPYARTLDGGKILVQAMVCEGENLSRTIHEAGQYGFEINEDASRLSFNSPYQLFAKHFETRTQESAREGSPTPSLEQAAA